MKTVKKRSQIQEKDVAEQFGGNTIVASGALWGAKGDVRGENVLIECKTTLKPYYPVKASVWEKIEREATRDGGRIPLLVIDLEDKDRLVVYDPTYFIKDIMPQPNENGLNNKSYRLSLKSIENDTYPYARQFQICGIHKHDLVATRIEDFMEYFLEEL